MSQCICTVFAAGNKKSILVGFSQICFTILEVHRLYLRDIVSSYNEMMENARSDYIRQLVTVNKKNPKVLFDTINSLVCPAASVTPVSCKTDSNALLRFFIDKIKTIKEKKSLPLCVEPLLSLSLSPAFGPHLSL